MSRSMAMAWLSFSARLSAVPLSVVWRSASPAASAGSGPKASAPCLRTITTWSHSAGANAKTSAAGPCTLAICGTPSRDMRSWQ